MATKIKRSSAIVMYWNRDQMMVENYLSGRAFSVDLETIKVLNTLDDWIDERELVGQLAEYSAESVRENVEILKELGLVVTEQNCNLEELVNTAWQHWGTEARFFHFVTKDAPYVSGEEETAFIESLSNETPPAIMKRYNAPRLFLPRAFLPMNNSFQEVLLGRRTTRAYSKAPIPLRTFATLLFYTFSPMYFVDAGQLGQLMMKTSASAGARHETEFYVGVLNVEGVPRGLYHYCQENHSLELLTEDYAPEKAVRFAYDQEWVADTGFVVYVTARFERMMWKYRHPRAYRTILTNLGHFGQTFSLCATALGLSPFVTAALREHELERDLDLDGVTESPMYMLACGVPAQEVGVNLHPELDAARLMPEGLVETFEPPRGAKRLEGK